jgi:hypothetical protein
MTYVTRWTPVVSAALLLALGSAGCSDDDTKVTPDTGADMALGDMSNMETAPDMALAEIGMPDQGVDQAVLPDISGTWEGTWASKSTGGSGTISATLTQSGASVSGNVTVTGSNLLTTGTLSGTLSSTLNGTSLKGKITGSSGNMDLDLMLAGNKLDGTYTVGTVDSGTIALTKK